ncbi:RcnB family protein [Paraburkholderia sp. G-4-1-8]|uniref:RcnB family protein n=2 Tax=Paraburkholderia antibiotica TaxID=2728839 RepID=A0A7Y0FG59_9BURK|nr:RcnB family protein [Paraburkholderia antibiotica]
MKSKSIAQLLIVALLGTSITAFAQPHDDQHHNDRPSHGPQRPGPDGHPGPQGRGQGPHDADVRRPGGPMPHADWHKGDRLPAEYRDRSYVVDDWRGHGLEAPPRGYHWVGVNGDYVLAAVATGVIASVLLSGH